MKHKLSKQLLSALLAFVMVVGLIPATSLIVHAGHSCPECQDWIDGSPYCSECYACEECIELCIQCGKCTDCTGAEICDGCTDEESGPMCTDCSEEKGAHCSECGTCYFIAENWCEECGACETCTEICDDCSVNLGYGLLCWECAEGKESHCPGCGNCYFEVGLWCEECSLCDDCSEIDTECSTHFGQILCKECVSDRGTHCPECEQCYFDVGSWCEECGKCADCSPACLYCCEEAGEVICEECAIDAGMHCPECAGCYDGGEYCTECGVCTACADICSTDEMCIECAIANGYHCPGCEGCGDQVILCEGCGERCNDCADAFCESCNLCSECVQICQGCGSCEECATICPNCEEYCSECAGLCDDCEFCLVCCADLAGFAGCDCGDWVCVESGDWEDHFNDTHTEADGSHSARPSPAWQRDDTYHWHGCSYCDEAGHRTGKSKHSYDATGKCTVCYYVKDAKIQIIVQPKDVKYVRVTSAEEDYDESNIAHFSVKAIGNSELTYTWCRRMYVGGQLTYAPLTGPGWGECYDGPNLAILAPTDACCGEYYICCFITDEEGNEVKTEDVLLTGRHDCQYYKQWRTHQRPYEAAERNKYGHILKCVGETCEKVTHLLPHEDEDRDGYCDVCDFEIGKILITKQPKDSRDAYVSSAIEDYSDDNYAHFHVEAEGESELTYTWCRKQYVQGVLTYVPLSGPDPNECYDGPDATIWVPTDACCGEYTYACIITDEEGNETRTVDVVLAARHNYQYYKDYLSTRENRYYDAMRKYHGHKLVCVGEGCGKVTRFRQHEDADHDYYCDVCDSQKDIFVPGISVTAPQEGQLPDYTVTSDSPAYFALGSTAYPGTRRVWMVSDDGETGWEPVDPTYPFEEGKYYKFYIEMYTAEGYEFPPMASYDGCPPYFWVTVNGNYTKAQALTGRDPLHHIFVECDFGACGDSGAETHIIENIVLEGVTPPVAGESPSYDCTIPGTGYTRNTAYDNGTYVFNGICWYDVTYDMWVKPNKTFQVGHEYKVFIDVKTEDDYWFLTSGLNYKPVGTGHINGSPAVLGKQFDARFEQSLSISFTCQPKTISAVAVTGLTAPRGGDTPDFTAVTDSEYYTVESVEWIDCENNCNDMTDTDTFVAGNPYWVLITVVPKTDEDVAVCKFVQDKTTATLNGVEVKKIKNDSWQEVGSGPKRVKIYYTFQEATTAYTVSFDAGSGAGTMAAEANVPVQYTLPACGFIAPEGYKFKAWAIGSVNGEQKQPGEQITVTGNTCIYAVWEEILPLLQGWQSVGSSWYYYDTTGTPVIGWLDDGGTWYFMNSAGVMQTGWQLVGSKWYYFNTSGVMQTGWQLVGSKWYYFNTSGAMQTGWQQIGGKWYYFNPSGAMQSGWQSVGGKWYFFNPSGAMQTGWLQSGSTRYYLNASGAMQTGWQQIGGKWYYFNASGAMQTGWRLIGDKWYFLDGSGVMQTGWLKSGNIWYYLNASGVMQIGWQQIGGKWYYFNTSGVMLTGWQLINNKWYFMNASGVWVP